MGKSLHGPGRAWLVTLSEGGLRGSRDTFVTLEPSTPTALLVVHGTVDAALLPEFAQAVYDAAVGEKELVWIETHNHVELYDQDPYVSEAAAHAVRWLDRHLGGS